MKYPDYVKAVDTELLRLTGKTHLELDEWVNLRLGWLAGMNPEQAASDILAELSY